MTYVDDMLVIFPFEVEIYIRAGLQNTYFIGHPLLEIIEEERTSFATRDEFAEKFGLDAGKSWLLAFPGSRKEEVSKHLSQSLILTRSEMPLFFCDPPRAGPGPHGVGSRCLGQAARR